MKSRRGPSATALLSPAQWLLLAGALVLGAVAYAQMHASWHPAAVAPVEISTDLLAAIGLSWTFIQLRTHWRDALQRRAWLLASAGMFAIWAAESTEWLSPLLRTNLEHEWVIVPLWLAAACTFLACGRVYAMRRLVMRALWCALALQLLAHASSVLGHTVFAHGGRLGALAEMVDDTSELLSITLYIAALVLTQFSPLKAYAFGPYGLGRKLRAISRDFGFRDPLAVGGSLPRRIAGAARGLWSDLCVGRDIPTAHDMRSLSAAFLRAHEAEDAIDGLTWWRRCESAGLPVAPTLALIGMGGSVFLRGAGAFDRDLFVCPRQPGAAGFAATFVRVAPLIYRARDGRALAFQDLCTELLVEAGAGELLVRPALDTHPEIAALADDGPVAFHLVTCLDARGTAQVTHGFLRRVSSGEPTATVGCSGELDTPGHGAAGPLRTRSTGWLQIKALAQAAHRLFPGQVLIGWDIAWTPDGAVLVGAGTEIDIALLQRCGIPLERSALAPLLERHLDALVASEAAARGL